MFLLTYFTERQEKGKEKVFPEFRFYTTHIKLRRKLKENRGRWSGNKKGSRAIAISVPFQPPQDLDASSMIHPRTLSPTGSKTVGAHTLMSDEMTASEPQTSHGHTCNCKILHSAAESAVSRHVAAHETFPALTLCKTFWNLPSNYCVYLSTIAEILWDWVNRAVVKAGSLSHFSQQQTILIDAFV